MKRIIRLTESDLTRIVKRVIKEEQSNWRKSDFRYKLIESPDQEQSAIMTFYLPTMKDSKGNEVYNPKGTIKYVATPQKDSRLPNVTTHDQWSGFAQMKIDGNLLNPSDSIKKADGTIVGSFMGEYNKKAFDFLKTQVGKTSDQTEDKIRMFAKSKWNTPLNAVYSVTKYTTPAQ